MHSKNLKVYDASLAGMVVDDLLKSFLDDYQFSLRTKMKKSNLTYDRVKISINRSGSSYIIAKDWVIYKKAIINPNNKNDNKCMQYAIIIALNYEKIDCHPKRISKIKPFINKYDWKYINFPSHKEDWNTLEKNNIFYVPHNTEQIRPAYISKYNCDRENQANLLMIIDGKK